MTSAYWYSSGVLQGRVTPQSALAPDGTRVFCLGIDAADPMPEFKLAPGESIEVRQLYAFDPTGVPLPNGVSFQWRMRQPAGAPAARRAVNAAPVIFSREHLPIDPAGTHGLFVAGDGLRGLRVATGTPFLPEDHDRLARVSGASSDNNGVFRIAAACADPTLPRYKQALCLEHPGLVEETAAACTVDILGLRWVARAYIDDNLRAELVEDASHEVQRAGFCLHVSQLQRDALIRFTLSLEEAT